MLSACGLNFEIKSYAVISFDTERDGKLKEVASFFIYSNQAIAINLTNSWHLEKMIFVNKLEQKQLNKRPLKLLRTALFRL